jgi:septin family protein
VRANQTMGEKKEEEQQLTAMLIGRSGSGKSVLAEKLLSNLTRKVYILNDKVGKSKYKPVDWPDVLNLKKCALVIEDLICMTRDELAVVRMILNFANHHRQVMFLFLFFASEPRKKCLRYYFILFCFFSRSTQ